MREAAEIRNQSERPGRPENEPFSRERKIGLLLLSLCIISCYPLRQFGPLPHQFDLCLYCFPIVNLIFRYHLTRRDARTAAVGVENPF